MKSGSSRKSLGNGLMALSMALMLASSLMSLGPNPTSLRLAVVPVFALLCLTFAYRAWRGSRA